MEGVSMEDLQHEIGSLRGFIRGQTGEDDPVALEILRNRGFWARLRPTAWETQIDQIKADEVRTRAEAKNRAFVLYTDLVLEAVRRQGDAMLATLGGKLRTNLTIFVAKEIDVVTDVLLAMRARFREKLQPEFAMVESYKADPVLQELYQADRQSLSRLVSGFFATIDELLQGFQDALKAHALA
jgi:hypothetical protein